MSLIDCILRPDPENHSNFQAIHSEKSIDFENLSGLRADKQLGNCPPGESFRLLEEEGQTARA